LSIETR